MRGAALPLMARATSAAPTAAAASTSQALGRPVHVGVAVATAAISRVRLHVVLVRAAQQPRPTLSLPPAEVCRLLHHLIHKVNRGAVCGPAVLLLLLPKAPLLLLLVSVRRRLPRAPGP
jgi:hypothetical protein